MAVEEKKKKKRYGPPRPPLDAAESRDSLAAPKTRQFFFFFFFFSFFQVYVAHELLKTNKKKKRKGTDIPRRQRHLAELFLIRVTLVTFSAATSSRPSQIVFRRCSRYVYINMHIYTALKESCRHKIKNGMKLLRAFSAGGFFLLDQ